MSKLIRNSIKCAHCGTEIESKHRHNYVSHTCKVGDREVYIAVDGGLVYSRRIGNRADFLDTTVYDDDHTGVGCEPTCAICVAKGFT